MQNPSIFIAFFAGVLSIASPCILPVIPSFIGYISGVSLSHYNRGLDKKAARKKLTVNTLCFAAGFSIIFLFFGAVIGAIGQALVLNRLIFQKIGGIVIIVLGLHLTGIFQTAFLQKERKIEVSSKFRKIEYVGSLLTGMSFAFGWAPCYGPIVGTIFTLAATQANFQQAMLLFFFYTLGFILPLLGLTWLVAHATHILKKFQKIARYSSVIAGIFVIILGILLYTNNLNSLVNWIMITYNKNNVSFL